jgi:uncharacterized membrane protein
LEVRSRSGRAIDRRFDFALVPSTLIGGPDAALGILQTVAASIVSLAALVLTITMVVVQLAMGQFSPRIVQRVLRDKPSQIAIGIFVATFAHAMLAMREVRFEDGGSVPDWPSSWPTSWFSSASWCWCCTYTTSAKRCASPH